MSSETTESTNEVAEKPALELSTEQIALINKLRPTAKELSYAMGADFLSSLSIRVGVWAAANFDDKHPYSPVIGLGEEVGELCEHLAINPLQVQVGVMMHSQLKHIQKIRTDVDHEANFDEAQGNVRDMTCDPLEFCEPSLREPSGPQNIVKAKDSVGDIFIYLCDVCFRNGWDLGEIVSATWDEVKNRDWRTNPADAHLIAERLAKGLGDNTEQPEYSVVGKTPLGSAADL